MRRGVLGRTRMRSQAHQLATCVAFHYVKSDPCYALLHVLPPMERMQACTADLAAIRGARLSAPRMKELSPAAQTPSELWELSSSAWPPCFGRVVSTSPAKRTRPA